MRLDVRRAVSFSPVGLCFHTFRHSAASIVNEQTGNLKLAQKFLGHSIIEMTADIYTHTSAEAERKAGVALERAIYGDLFPVVPKYREQEQLCGTELGEEFVYGSTRNYKKEGRLEDLPLERPWLRGSDLN